MNKCEACGIRVLPNENKSCKCCKKHYHYLCLNITQENFVKESKLSKAAWKCPVCKNRERKEDNSNTPVRPAAQPDSPIDTPAVCYPVASTSTATTTTQKQHVGVISSIGDDSSVVKELIGYFDLKFNEALEIIESKIDSESKITNDKITSLASGVEHLTTQIKNLKKIHEAQAAEIKELKAENSGLKTEVKDIKTRLMQMEQVARECNVEIQCVPESSSENVVDIVKKIGTVVSFNIKENDMITAHRVAKLQNDNPRPRSIVARLATPRIRDEFLAAVKTFNKNNVHNKLNTSHLT